MLSLEKNIFLKLLLYFIIFIILLSFYIYYILYHYILLYIVLKSLYITEGLKFKKNPTSIHLIAVHEHTLRMTDAQEAMLRSSFVLRC